MSTKNPFEMLGVGSDASPDEVKSAFRRMAKKYHPDIIGGSGEKFKRILLAYEQLSGYQNGSVAAAESFDWSIRVNIDRENDKVQDLFDDFRDGILSYFSVDAPEFLNLFIELTPADAARGGRIRLELPLVSKCRKCHGFGQIFFISCKVCGGSGEQSYQSEAYIDLPKGVESGSKVHLHVDRLFLTVIFRVMERKGSDI